MSGIPVVSLGDVAGFSSAFEQFGFCVIHDLISDSQVKELRNAAYTFFRSSLEDKMKYSVGDSYGPPGYTASGIESVNQSTNTDRDHFIPDAVESFVYHGTPSENVPEVLYESLIAYTQTMNDILDRLMQTTALSQNQDRNFFKKPYENRSCALRLAFYPAGVSPKYGAHTDYTGFTLLSAERERPGLRVLYDGDWIDVTTGNNNDLIVNAGDLIPVWTNGRFKSAVHRVVVSEETMTSDRLSLVYFTGPSDDTLVKPLVNPGEREDLFAPVLSGEHLRRKLNLTTK